MTKAQSTKALSLSKGSTNWSLLEPIYQNIKTSMR